VFWKNEMTGMSCWYENHDRISGNTFAANLREGLSVLGASEPVIEQNIFWQNPQGVQQGNISGDGSSPLGTLQLRDNLFWMNAVNVEAFAPLLAAGTNGISRLSLADFPGNREADPGFRNVARGDFSLLADGTAAKSGIGANAVLPVASFWPLQPEEKAIIPDGDTRDSRQWKRPGLR
jgi:hypothetical protein